MDQRHSGGRRVKDAEPVGISGKCFVARRDPERGIVEQRDLSVGVCHRGEEPKAAFGGGAPPGDDRRRDDSRPALGRVDQIEQVLDEDRVIHRAALEMAAVGELLFVQLRRDDGKAGRAPRIGLSAFEKKSCEDQRFRIGEQVIAEQMPFEPLLQPACLKRQAGGKLGMRIVAGNEPFDPVHDSQRHRIRFPAGPRRRRVLGDPATCQRAGHRIVVRYRIGTQPVEIVKIIPAQLVDRRVIPPAGIRQRMDLTEQIERSHPHPRSRSRHGLLPGKRPGPSLRRRRDGVEFWQHAKPRASVKLHRLQMFERVPVARRRRQHCWHGAARAAQFGNEQWRRRESESSPNEPGIRDISIGRASPQ